MTTIAQMLNENRRQNLEWATGRIEMQDSIYTLVKDRPDVQEILTETGKPFHIEDEGPRRVAYQLTEDGGLRAVKRGKAARCPNLNLWPDAYQSGGRAWVPAKDCRACTFYRKTKETRYPYPTCDYARKTRCGELSPETTAARRTLSQFTETVQAVKEIFDR